MHVKFSLLEILSEPPEIVVVDVGASIIEGEVDRYMPLVDRKAARVIGFEPDADERNKLKTRYPDGRIYLPYFIGRGGAATFHQTNWIYTGSLLDPNTPLLDHFQALNDVTRLVGKHAIQTHRLDEISEVDAMDFLKVDVQGGELAAFEGAERLLRDCLVIQTEVEFVQLYKDQPLFAMWTNFFVPEDSSFIGSWDSAAAVSSLFWQWTTPLSRAVSKSGPTRFTSGTSCACDN